LNRRGDETSRASGFGAARVVADGSAGYDFIGAAGRETDAGETLGREVFAGEVFTGDVFTGDVFTGGTAGHETAPTSIPASIR
jgi:hypothetical protein